mgnify:FL=1
MMTYQFKSIKDAEAVVGGLSRPSKMPSFAWSISARRCNTGSKLVNVKGSVCEGCYALKNRYLFNNIQSALENRYNKWKTNRNKWTDAMIYLMHNKQHIVNTGHFRFFDSGDIQGVEMLNDINTVAWASPHIRFWLPTKEYKLIKDYDIDVAPNLVIRVSAPMIDASIDGYTHISTVYQKDKIGIANGYVCPAPKQGNKCDSCRACWNDSISEVSYISH